MQKNKEMEIQPGNNYDSWLINRIQPQGGISFTYDESYIRTGTGYCACLHVYKYASNITDNWMAQISNIDDTIVTFDISSEDMAEVKKNLNKSVNEQSSRAKFAGNFTTLYDAQKRVDEMASLYDEIENLDEVIKKIQIRVFVAAKSKANLEEKIASIMTKLESNSFPAAVFLNETQAEYSSMFQPYTQQLNETITIPAMPVSAWALGNGNPFHFSELHDPHGDLLGYTPCGGNVLFDEFRRTKSRLFYNCVAIGSMRAGKSTLLKKRMKARAIRGDFIRTFDITGEFQELTKHLGGKIIKSDGSEGIINMLEILRAGDNESLNYARHITKVITQYKYLNPKVEEDEILELRELLNKLYEKWNLVPDGEKQISGIGAEKYPNVSDLLDMVTQDIEKEKEQVGNVIENNLRTSHLLKLVSIQKSLKFIVNTYGYLFDGYTSMDNVVDEQIVCFDLSGIKDLESNVFDAVIFNYLSLCWDNCVTNGAIMKELWESGKIAWEDIVRFEILIDESHRWVNTKKTQALELLNQYMREAPKYFGGIILASQSIRDYVPEGSNAVEMDKLKSIFELTQYKFIFRQDQSAIPVIDVVFENILTTSQRERIPKLDTGSTILCISGERNIEMEVYVTEEEKRIFKGGA